MECLGHEKVGFFANAITRENLKAGDHIYSWRLVYLYAHHGIYIGNGEVIHFTCVGGEHKGKRHGIKKMFSSSSIKSKKPCPNCADKKLDRAGVVISCLDCFVGKGSLYHFDYGVSVANFEARHRSGTCTTAISESPDEVIARAKILLSTNSFGEYHLLENNCEDFAIYCKTSLRVVGERYLVGRSGQAYMASAAACMSGIKRALNKPTEHASSRLLADIGMRSDAIKVPVESLVSSSASAKKS